jgi:DNA-binding protein Fis
MERALDYLFGELRRGDEPVLARVERELAARALAAEDGDSAKAAKLLGLTASALQKKLKAK